MVRVFCFMVRCQYSWIVFIGMQMGHRKRKLARKFTKGFV